MSVELMEQGMTVQEYLQWAALYELEGEEQKQALDKAKRGAKRR